MPLMPEDDLGTLERARKRLYQPATPALPREPLTAPQTSALPHAWEDSSLDQIVVDQKRGRGRHPVRLAGVFFIAAIIFFLTSISVAAYIFYSGGNSISVDKVSVSLQGPTTIAGGDTVPFTITITNTNAVPIQNATINIDFPSSTRNSVDVLQPYPRYTENLGTLASGATITRSVKAVLFGGTGQTISLPISLSYAASGSNAVFVKKSSYAVLISTTPLSVSVDTLSETVSGQSLTLALEVRSNASIPLDNVVVNALLPFGFTVQSSSVPLVNSSFLLGTLPPGASKSIKLTGTLSGQQGDKRVFHFTVGTAKSAQDQTLAVTYMSQDALVSLVAPFINATLAINGDTSPNIILTPGNTQSITVSYTNTLPTTISNATIAVTIEGTGVDYNSIQSSNGFYRSADHSVLFSRDTDPSLALLAPGASGVGTIVFSTLPASSNVASPAVSFTTSVSGTRVGQSNVPEQVTASQTKVAKVATAVALAAASLRTSGPFPETGPIPPRVGLATTYTIQWSVGTQGSPIAGASMSAVLPSYVSYTGLTNSPENITYDTGSRTVTWNIGDLAPATEKQGAFQVSLKPSSSQKGGTPSLTTTTTFSGYDRFSGTQIKGSVPLVTTETLSEPGYIAANAVVQ